MTYEFLPQKCFWNYLSELVALTFSNKWLHNGLHICLCITGLNNITLISSLSVPLCVLYPGPSLTCAPCAVQILADGKRYGGTLPAMSTPVAVRGLLTSSISARAPVLTAARRNELQRAHLHDGAAGGWCLRQARGTLGALVRVSSRTQTRSDCVLEGGAHQPASWCHGSGGVGETPLDTHARICPFSG